MPQYRADEAYQNDVRVGMPRGVKLCKSEGVICSEGVKRCKSWAAQGGKML